MTSTFLEEFEKIPTSKDIVRSALITTINHNLSKCTDSQQKFFDKVYPEPLSVMSENTLKMALDLINRTLAKNRSGRE